MGIVYGILTILGLIIIGVFITVNVFFIKGNSISSTQSYASALNERGDEMVIARSSHRRAGPSQDAPPPENQTLATALLAERIAGVSDRRLSADDFKLPARMSAKEVQALLQEGKVRK